MDTARAVAELEKNGFTVLEDVVDVAHLEILRPRMLEDVAAVLARDDVPVNFTSGHIQQDPPPFPPFLFRDILANDAVIAVTRSVLGERAYNDYYSGNTNLPGSKPQPVHPDTAQLWPGLTVATPAFSIVVNVPVVDMDVSNGSTELWPGTHKDTTVSVKSRDNRVPPDVLEARRAIAPPVQLSVKAGSVVLRDMRLWHRGMPNLTDRPRPMIAMVHWISWWAKGPAWPFPQGTESLFTHPDLVWNATFTDGPIDYLSRNESFDVR